MDQDYRSPRNALERYIDGIEEWIAAVRSGASLNGLTPIDSQTDTNNLNDLANRANSLRLHILPQISENKFYPGPQSSQ
jgi:hypothetical protein